MCGCGQHPRGAPSLPCRGRTAAAYDDARSVGQGRDADLVSRSLLWMADKPQVERLITHGPLTQRVVNRFVAGTKLDDAIDAIEELNPRGIGGILDLLGEGVVDRAPGQARPPTAT